MKLNTKESKWMNRTLCENIIKNTTTKKNRNKQPAITD